MLTINYVITEFIDDHVFSFDFYSFLFDEKKK